MDNPESKKRKLPSGGAAFGNWRKGVTRVNKKLLCLHMALCLHVHEVSIL